MHMFRHRQVRVTRREILVLNLGKIRRRTRRGIAITGGFTLIEAMIASLILAFVLVSVVGLSSRGFQYLAGIRSTARSSQVLQQKMEDLRLLSWSQLQAQPGPFTVTDSLATYQGTLTRTPYDFYNGTATTMKVTLTLTWMSRNGHVLTNRLSTLISNGGLNKYIF